MAWGWCGCSAWTMQCGQATFSQNVVEAKKSGHPESSQGPSDICNLYSQMLYQLSYSRLEVFSPNLPSRRRARLVCAAVLHRATLAGLEPAIFSSSDPKARSPREQTDALSIMPQGLCCRRHARMHVMKSGVAQWLACWAHIPKVRGSTPRSAIICTSELLCHYDVAKRQTSRHFARVV